MKKIRYKLIGKGNRCPKCKEEMERRGHNERPTKTWYYKQWDYCRPCGHLQHYEEFKSDEWKEAELNENFLNNI